MRRVAVVLLLALLAGGVLAAPAAAAPVVTPDRAGDGRRAGDVRVLRLTRSATALVAQIRTQRGLDVTTAPTWTSEGSATILRFNFDTDGDRQVERAVVLQPAPGGPDVVLFGVLGGPTPRGDCAIVSQPQPTIIRVRVQLGCLDIPARSRGFARYRLDVGANGTIDSDDRAPNVGWSRRLQP